MGGDGCSGFRKVGLVAALGLAAAGAATPQVLSFSRIFSFADPLEAVQEAPGGLSEAVLQRSYPALAPPFGGDAVDPGGPAGLQLDGARMVSWSLWMVNGIPDAVESVEIAFTSERPWHPFEVAWPAR